MSSRPTTALASALLVACWIGSDSRAGVPPFAPQGEAWDAPALADAVSIRDGRTGEVLTIERLFERLAEADAVFLGETHTDETTHRFELAVYEGLIARREGRVVLALEMFQRDVQQHVDDYVAGRTDEEAFLAVARPWGQYLTAYRPLIERARADGLPVVASNFPRPLLGRIAMEGRAVLDSLGEDERDHVPAELHPNTALYRKRSDNAVRSHIGMMRLDPDDPERLYATQTLWDNAMGDACARALDQHPGSAVLHVNGYFHSAYWDGTARQLMLRKPDAKVLTVTVLPAANPSTVTLGGAPSADFLVFAESRATDLDDGAWSVRVQRELEYRLHLPDAAGAEAPVPLLIWLSDDGFRAQDGLALWKQRLGEEAAIAVIDPPYRAIQEDLSEGGSWFWPDSFAEDIATMDTAIARTWGYLLRHFPVDPERVVIAGEGTGATIVAASSLLNQRVSARAVAFAPRRYAKIKEFPLPLPEDRGDDPPPEKTLRLLLEQADEAWWTAELAEYAAIGFEATSTRATDDPWGTELERENALREALGLEASAPATASSRRYVSVALDSPRSRWWSRLAALRFGAEGGQPVAVLSSAEVEAGGERLALEVAPEEVQVPRCPGPFGGTTVLVVAEGCTGAQREAWAALEESDPLAAESRFHRLRVATGEDGRELTDVLAKLQEEGRTNVLVVPAAFCADGATMRALKRSVDRLADRMSLHWLPGLGGAALED